MTDGHHAGRHVFLDPIAQNVVGVVDRLDDRAAVGCPVLSLHQAVEVVVGVSPGLAGGDLRLLDEVAFIVVGEVPGAVGGELIGRAGRVAGVGPVAVGVVAVAGGRVGEELVGGVVGVGRGRAAVQGLGRQVAGGIVGIDIAGQRSCPLPSFCTRSMSRPAAS